MIISILPAPKTMGVKFQHHANILIQVIEHFYSGGGNSCLKMKEPRWRHKLSSHRLHYRANNWLYSYCSIASCMRNRWKDLWRIWFGMIAYQTHQAPSYTNKKSLFGTIKDRNLRICSAQLLFDYIKTPILLCSFKNLIWHDSQPNCSNSIYWAFLIWGDNFCSKV